MAVPVWLWPVTKKLGLLVFSNRHQLVDIGKTYGPPALRGYRTHGLKPGKIVRFVQAELSHAMASQGGQGKAKKVVARAKRPKRKRS